MVGPTVFTQTYVEEHKGQGDIGNSSIGMGSYNYDMHNAQRYACTNKTVCTHWSTAYAWNEGDVETNPGYEYQIPYFVLTPKQEEATNLLVPVCVSASHVGYGTLRLEPQYMIMGQSAGTAASLAIQDKVAVQEVNLNTLTGLLQAGKQILRPAPPPPPPPPAPPAPPAKCTFQNNTWAQHGKEDIPVATAQECCNHCAATSGCIAAVFRWEGEPVNTCWPITTMTATKNLTGVALCVVSK